MESITNILKNSWYVVVGWGIIYQYAYLSRIDTAIIEYYTIYDFAKSLIIPFVVFLISFPFIVILRAGAYTINNEDIETSKTMREGLPWNEIIKIWLISTPFFLFTNYFTFLLFPFIYTWDKIDMNIYKYFFPIKTPLLIAAFSFGPTVILSAASFGLDAAQSDLRSKGQYRIIFQDDEYIRNINILRILENHMIIYERDKKSITVLNMKDINSWELDGVDASDSYLCSWFGWCLLEYEDRETASVLEDTSTDPKVIPSQTIERHQYLRTYATP